MLLLLSFCMTSQDYSHCNTSYLNHFFKVIKTVAVSKNATSIAPMFASE